MVHFSLECSTPWNLSLGVMWLGCALRCGEGCCGEEGRVSGLSYDINMPYDAILDLSTLFEGNVLVRWKCIWKWMCTVWRTLFFALSHIMRAVRSRKEAYKRKNRVKLP